MSLIHAEIEFLKNAVRFSQNPAMGPRNMGLRRPVTVHSTAYSCDGFLAGVDIRLRESIKLHFTYHYLSSPFHTEGPELWEDSS